ncbi:MAG: Spx/MgsR family RNA polymerase-binding regulatory protein [Pseudomonadota bacterium]
MTTSIYGIPNCDHTRQARRWLAGHGIACRFHDVRAAGLEPGRLAEWIAALGWEALVNRRSATWRQLDAATRARLAAATAADLLRAAPTLLRRPVLEHRGAVHVGFSPESYQRILGAG